MHWFALLEKKKEIWKMHWFALLKNKCTGLGKKSPAGLTGEYLHLVDS